jgi:hypothetical protein
MMIRDPNQLRDKALRYFQVACLISDPIIAKGVSDSACELQRLADALEALARSEAWAARAAAPLANAAAQRP